MKKTCSFFLILVMLVSPLASALDHCSTMLMPEQSMAGQTSPLMMEMANPSHAKQTPQHDPSATPQIDCQTMDECGFQQYSAYLASPSSFQKTDVSSAFSAFNYHPYRNQLLSALFRPPIAFL